MVERLKSSERGRRKVELSLFTHNLSSELLAKPDGELGVDVSSEVYTAFSKGSLTDRKTYWRETAREKNFGTQILDWIGRGEKPGIAQWIASQSDGDVIGMLSEVGLKSTPEKTKQDLQGENVQHLLSVVNADLAKVGQPALSADNLSVDEARSLIFYATFLSGANGPTDTKSLVDTLSGYALQASNNNSNEAIAKLQKVAPLLSTAGEEAQFALGAILVAKTHALTDRDKLKKPSTENKLSDADHGVLSFLVSNAYEGQKPLEFEQRYNVIDVLDDVEPKATKNHPYWIDHAISTDFAQKLTPEQLKSLELTLPFFTNVNLEKGTWQLNRDVFDPAYTLENNARFKNAEMLTQNDSGLFALAAVAASTPEQQAKLYQQLGETVLRVHQQNPELLRQFLEAQPDASREIFNYFEGTRAQFALSQNLGGETEKAYTAEVTRLLPGVDLNSMESLSKLTTEQRKILEDVFMRQRLPIYQKVMGDIATDPDRVLALNTKYAGEFHIQYEFDIPKTVEAWKGRIGELQEALSSNPLTLTPEQIRQIEFLAHSVNVVQAMEWLGATVPAPEERRGESQPVGEILPQSLPMGDFLQSYDNLEEKIKEQSEVVPPRQELAVMDSTHMAEFATNGMNVLDLEITEGTGEDKKLAIYTLSQKDGQVIPEYNENNPFLKQLHQEYTISGYVLDTLAQQDMGSNTLLAYVMEASSTLPQREALIKNLFAQIRSIYSDHDNAREGMHTYLTELVRQSQYEAANPENSHAERLFSSKEVTLQRLTELSDLLTSNKPLSIQDFRDMAMFALPFNLQYLSQLMEQAYVSHAGSAPDVSPEIEQ